MKKLYLDRCSIGGWASKIGPEVLSDVLSKLPSVEDKNLIVGFDKSDDAAVYKLTDDIAMIKRFKELCEKLNFDIDPMEITRNMSISK